MRIVTLTAILLLPFFSISQKVTLNQMLIECQRNNILFDVSLLTSGDISKMSKSDIETKLKSNKSASIKNNAETIMELYDDREFRPMQASDNSIIGEYTTENKLAGLFFTSLTYDKAFNTLQTDTKERITSVCENMLFDFLETAYDVVAKTKHQNIAVHTIVLSKNFLEGDEKYNYDTESFILSVNVSALKNFLDKKTTDKQFLKQCSFYVLPNNAKSFRKTTI